MNRGFRAALGDADCHDRCAHRSRNDKLVWIKRIDFSCVENSRQRYKILPRQLEALQLQSLTVSLIMVRRSSARGSKLQSALPE